MKSGGLSYYGGKSPRRELTRWIASRLPWDYYSLYCEPFAGMLGVLLTRRAVRLEVVNDVNERLVNWWRVIRDHPQEFGHQLDWTHQQSRVEFAAAKRDLDHPDPVRRAVAFTIVVNNSLQHTDNDGNRWGTYFAVGAGGVYSWCSKDILRLRERTKHVQLECIDAVELLGRVAGEKGAVVYVDPPYRSADTKNYRFLPDWDKLTEALKAQKGSVAVSGYGDDWDHLGWACEEFECHAMVYDAQGGNMNASGRTEKLWMNYDPPSDESLFTLP